MADKANESGQKTISGQETISQEAISGQETIFEGNVRDWRKDAQVDLPAEDQREYHLHIRRGYPGGSQFAINIAPRAPEGGQSDYPPQLAAALEIDNGVPTLHVGDDRYEDFSLSLFFTEKGLIIRPQNVELEKLTDPELIKKFHAEGSLFIPASPRTEDSSEN